MGGSHRPGQLNSSASSSKLADGCGLRWGLFFQFFMDLFLANVHHQIWMILVLWYGFVLCFLMMFTLWYGFFDCFFVFFYDMDIFWLDFRAKRPAFCALLCIPFSVLHECAASVMLWHWCCAVVRHVSSTRGQTCCFSSMQYPIVRVPWGECLGLWGRQESIWSHADNALSLEWPGAGVYRMLWLQWWS